MPSNLFRSPRKIVNIHAERNGVSSQAEVTHAAAKDVSESDEQHRIPPRPPPLAAAHYVEDEQSLTALILP